MSRESNDGHVCPICLETIFHEDCLCTAQCSECFHPLSLHGSMGCEFERTVQVEASSETMSGPCGCSALECDGSVSTAEIYERAGLALPEKRSDERS